MLKGIAKAVAYYKAPVQTFAVLHPFKALKWAGIFFVVGALLKRPPHRGGELGAG